MGTMEHRGPAILKLNSQPVLDEEPGIVSQAGAIGEERWAFVSYAPGSARADWCLSGHRGLVVEGQVVYELEGDRAPISLHEGDAFLLPAGLAHRGRNDGERPAKLFL